MLYRRLTNHMRRPTPSRSLIPALPSLAQSFLTELMREVLYASEECGRCQESRQVWAEERKRGIGS